MKHALLLTAAAILLGSAHFQLSANRRSIRAISNGARRPPACRAARRPRCSPAIPNGPALFTIRLRFPAGYAVPPHSHPADEHVTVISGQLSLGMGPRVRPRRMATLVPGGFANAPARMAHYASTRSGR